MHTIITILVAFAVVAIIAVLVKRSLAKAPAEVETVATAVVDDAKADVATVVSDAEQDVTKVV